MARHGDLLPDWRRRSDWMVMMDQDDFRRIARSASLMTSRGYTGEVVDGATEEFCIVEQPKASIQEQRYKTSCSKTASLARRYSLPSEPNSAAIKHILVEPKSATILEIQLGRVNTNIKVAVKLLSYANGDHTRTICAY